MSSSLTMNETVKAFRRYPTPVVIRPSMLQTFSDIRAVKPDGVNDLYNKMKDNGWLTTSFILVVELREPEEDERWQDQTYGVIDGMHRVEAARKCIAEGVWKKDKTVHLRVYVFNCRCI